MLLPSAFGYKLAKKNIPLNVSFELTWRCNLRCIHCYQNPPQDNELKKREIKNILNQLARAGCLFITLTGGEPLIREDFLDIARYARRKEFALELKTNGTLIDSYLAKWLRKLNFLEVDISIYGAGAQTHDAITRKQGSFNKVISAVKYLKEEGVKVWLMLTLMRQNIGELKQIRALAESLGVELFCSPLIYARHDKGGEPLSFRLTNESIRDLYWQDIQKEKSLVARADGPGLLCQFGRTACAINPVGEVYPCIGAPIVVGNFRDSSFKNIWQTSHLLSQIRSITNSELEECSICGLARYCFRCGGAAYLEEGDIKAPHKEACRLAKIKKQI